MFSIRCLCYSTETCKTQPIDSKTIAIGIFFVCVLIFKSECELQA